MKMQYFLGCMIAAGSLVIVPELSLAHGGGGGGRGGGGGGHGFGGGGFSRHGFGASAAAFSGRGFSPGLAGRMDFRIAIFSGGVIAVSMDATAVFAIVASAILTGAFWIRASTTSYTQIFTTTTTPITIDIRIITTMPI